MTKPLNFLKQKWKKEREKEINEQRCYKYNKKKERDGGGEK